MPLRKVVGQVGPFSADLLLQPYHAQRLPRVLARAESALCFIAGFFKLVLVNPALDDLFRAISQFLLKLGYLFPELSLCSFMILLPGSGQRSPHFYVDAVGLHRAGPVVVTRWACQLARTAVGPADLREAFAPGP
jgi:hypothetical protein